MLVHNNYFQCYYNNNPLHIMKTDNFDRWDIHFNFDVMEKRPIRSFKQELLYACELMYDTLRKYNPKLNIFLSGGTDSEALVRCFHELKIPINPLIIRHVAIPNSDETILALKICEELELKPTILDLDLFKIYDVGTAVDIAIKYQSYHYASVEILYVMEQLSEPVILGDELSIIYITTGQDLFKKDEYNYHKWYFYMEEDFDAVYSRYQYLTGIPVITDSFKYTPQCWAAMIKTPEISDIVLNNRGKMSGRTTKNKMMSREFGIQYREKTSVFTSGPYAALIKELPQVLSTKVLPHQNINIEYHELLTILDSGKL